jgi:hypothetical protein
MIVERTYVSPLKCFDKWIPNARVVRESISASHLSRECCHLEPSKIFRSDLASWACSSNGDPRPIPHSKVVTGSCRQEPAFPPSAALFSERPIVATKCAMILPIAIPDWPLLGRKATIRRSVGNEAHARRQSQGPPDPNACFRRPGVAAAALGISYRVSKYFVAAGNPRCGSARIAHLSRGTR